MRRPRCRRMAEWALRGPDLRSVLIADGASGDQHRRPSARLLILTIALGADSIRLGSNQPLITVVTASGGERATGVPS
jgi:hypothetical protein